MINLRECEQLELVSQSNDAIPLLDDIYTVNGAKVVIPQISEVSSDFVEYIMERRGIINEKDKELFLKRSVKDMWPQPGEILDLDKAIEVCYSHIKAGNKIGIIGDYDVDGNTSTSLLVLFFKAIGADHVFKIPNRFIDGYGVTPGCVKELYEKGAKAVITVDNGTTAYDAINLAKEYNLDFIIIDHHGLQDPIEVSAFVNPQRSGGRFATLCAAGLTFIFLVELNKYMKQQDKEFKGVDVFAWIDLVAVATICDVMKLEGLNRGLVYHGLNKLNTNPSICFIPILALHQEAEYDPTRVGFCIGPYINVAGRFGFSHRTVALLTSSSLDEAQKIASMLGIMNSERRNIEAAIIKECELQYNQQKGNDAFAFTGEEWHEGVLGIVAGKTKSAYGKTSCVLSLKDEYWKGSIRSTDDFHVNTFIKEGMERGIIAYGGGHAMAGGLNVYKDKKDEFCKFIVEFAKTNKNESTKLIEVDGILSLCAVNIKNVEKIRNMGPFGTGNPEPLFLFPNCSVQSFKPFNNGKHALFRISGASLMENSSAVAFDINEKMEILYKTGARIHLIATIKICPHQSYAQLVIQDIAQC